MGTKVLLRRKTGQKNIYILIYTWYISWEEYLSYIKIDVNPRVYNI